MMSDIYAYHYRCLVFENIYELCPWGHVARDNTVADDMRTYVNRPRPVTTTHELSVNVNIARDRHRVNRQYSLPSDDYAKYQAGCIALSISTLNSQVERRPPWNQYLEAVFGAESRILDNVS